MDSRVQERVPARCCTVPEDKGGCDFVSRHPSWRDMVAGLGDRGIQVGIRREWPAAACLGDVPSPTWRSSPANWWGA